MKKKTSMVCAVPEGYVGIYGPVPEGYIGIYGPLPQAMLLLEAL